MNRWGWMTERPQCKLKQQPKSENTGKVFGQIRAQTTRKAFQEQVIPESWIKHQCRGHWNKAKQKGKVRPLATLVKGKRRKRGGNLVLCKTKENHKIRGL